MWLTWMEYALVLLLMTLQRRYLRTVAFRSDHAHAEATGSIRGLGRQGKGVQEAKFVGVPGAPGAAVGTAVVVLPPADLNVVPDRSVDDIAAERVQAFQWQAERRATDADRADGLAAMVEDGCGNAADAQCRFLHRLEQVIHICDS